MSGLDAGQLGNDSLCRLILFSRFFYVARALLVQSPEVLVFGVAFDSCTQSGQGDCLRSMGSIPAASATGLVSATLPSLSRRVCWE
jgi:hypothetical protein